MKKHLPLLLSLCLIVSMVCAFPASASAESAGYGLTASFDGRIQLQGSDFYGYGGNAFWLVDRSLQDPFYDIDGVFQTFEKYTIPIVRIPFCSSLESG